jgi:hypothetical protein
MVWGIYKSDVRKKRRRKLSNAKPLPRGRPFGPDNPPKGRPKGTVSYKQMVRSMFSDLLNDKKFIKDYNDTFKSEASKEGTWQAKFIADKLYLPDIIDQLDAQFERQRKEDLDFQHYRIWRRGHEIQRQMLGSRARKMYCMAGRRSGKTEGERLLIADALLEHPDARCLYIGLTITKAQDLLWQPVLDLLSDMGIKVKEKNRSDGHILTDSGAWIQFGGNTTKDEREKNRGPWWDVVIIDECQSQKDLRYLIETILEPELIDRKGKLVLSGTAPRIRGTDWEYYWDRKGDGATRLNWNLTQNPFIKDADKVLAEILREKGLTENNPLFVREYLGKVAYDDDALVYRLGDSNKYTDDKLLSWISSQPITDIRFSGGLDFGFTDSDGVAIICYSSTLPERWLIYEYKANRQGTAELADKIRAGIEYVKTSPLFQHVPEEQKQFFFYADTGGGGQKIAYDLSTQYTLPIMDAYKANKDMAIELLQDEVRRGIFKVREGGAMWQECLRTVFRRNERDELTREVDDETYHPDEIDAVTYAMRPIWIFNRKL